MWFTHILHAGGRALAKNSASPTKKTLPAIKKNPNKRKVTAAPKQSAGLLPLETHPPDLARDTLLVGEDEHDPSASDQLAADPTHFSGRVHSESYSVDNLSAAFRSILSSSSSSNHYHLTDSKDQGTTSPTQVFLSAIKNSTLSTLETYRSSIIESLAQDDPNGRIYSKNVRQMKDILGFEKWRKKLEQRTLELSTNHPSETTTKVKTSSSSKLKTTKPTTKSSLSLNKGTHSLPAFCTRKELEDRPTISDPLFTQKLIHEFWNLDKLNNATVLVSYSGFPTLIDELLKLKNIKKVIAIEEKPEYCLMYTDRWKEQVLNKRLFHIKNDGYWWESYSEVEEEGLLDDVPIEPWEKAHPSLFFICQLPHNKRSLQFIMQLISFIPNRNWLFQYGRVRLGFIGGGDISQRMTRERSEKKYTRITAAANCLTTIERPSKSTEVLKPHQFFPTNFNLENQASTGPNSEDDNDTQLHQNLTTKNTTNTRKKTKSKIPKKIYKSSPEANPPPFAAALHFIPKSSLDLSPEEFECMNFLQKVMFIHSAQSWVESISHAAAGASIMYEKLKEIDKKNQVKSSSATSTTSTVERYYIAKSKTPRSFSALDWIHLAKTFNKWPFRPQSFENDLELEADDGSTV